jgi:hypothetical protein
VPREPRAQPRPEEIREARQTQAQSVAHQKTGLSSPASRSRNYRVRRFYQKTFSLPPPAIKRCMQPCRGEPRTVRCARGAVGRQAVDDEPRNVAGVHEFGLPEHPLCPAPALPRPTVEPGELAQPGCAAEPAPHPGPDQDWRRLSKQHGIFRGPEAAAKAPRRFAPGHYFLGAKPTVAPHDDPRPFAPWPERRQKWGQCGHTATVPFFFVGVQVRTKKPNHSRTWPSFTVTF